MEKMPNMAAVVRLVADRTKLLGTGTPSETSGQFVEHLASFLQRHHSGGAAVGQPGSWGLHRKTSGNRYHNHSTDRITYNAPDGHTYSSDVVVSGDTKDARPGWNLNAKDPLLADGAYMAPDLSLRIPGGEPVVEPKPDPAAPPSAESVVQAIDDLAQEVRKLLAGQKRANAILEALARASGVTVPE
jgi:hypothetical protein